MFSLRHVNEYTISRSMLESTAKRALRWNINTRNHATSANANLRATATTCWHWSWATWPPRGATSTAAGTSNRRAQGRPTRRVRRLNRAGISNRWHSGNSPKSVISHLEVQNYTLEGTRPPLGIFSQAPKFAAVSLWRFCSCGDTRNGLKYNTHQHRCLCTFENTNKRSSTISLKPRKSRVKYESDLIAQYCCASKDHLRIRFGRHHTGVSMITTVISGDAKRFGAKQYQKSKS